MVGPGGCEDGRCFPPSPAHEMQPDRHARCRLSLRLGFYICPKCAKRIAGQLRKTRSNSHARRKWIACGRSGAILSGECTIDCRSSHVSLTTDHRTGLGRIELDGWNVLLTIVVTIDPVCTPLRGATYDPARSSTWDLSGFYPLEFDQQLGFGGYGQYGFDTVALGDNVSIASGVVNVVNATEYWLGLFGLGITTVKLNQTNKKTVLTTMVETGLVPSHSYGYTAGAFYREHRDRIIQDQD